MSVLSDIVSRLLSRTLTTVMNSRNKEPSFDTAAVVDDDDDDDDET